MHHTTVGVELPRAKPDQPKAGLLNAFSKVSQGDRGKGLRQDAASSPACAVELWRAGSLGVSHTADLLLSMESPYTPAKQQALMFLIISERTAHLFRGGCIVGAARYVTATPPAITQLLKCCLGVSL